MGWYYMTNGLIERGHWHLKWGEGLIQLSYAGFGH